MGTKTGVGRSVLFQVQVSNAKEMSAQDTFQVGWGCRWLAVGKMAGTGSPTCSIQARNAVPLFAVERELNLSIALGLQCFVLSQP
jgi:hypothetical protein